MIAAAMGWLLWQGVGPVIPSAPTEGAAVIQSYDTKDACLKAATTKRATRNALAHKGGPAYEVFTLCTGRSRSGARPLRVVGRARTGKP